MPGDVLDDEEPTCPCKKKINILMLECDQCETFWHISCCGLTGLTQQPINKLIANHWKCPRCFKFSEEIPTEDSDTVKTNLDEDTVNSIVALVNTTVIKSLKTLLSPEDSDEDSDTEELQATAADDGNDFTVVSRKKRKRIQQEKQQERSFQKALEEQREEEILIEKKKDNLIIYGMPEAATEDKKEEMLADFNNLKKVYEGKLNVEQADLTHISRLGKKGTNVRPILITLANQNKRKELLTNNMNLKLNANHESTSIYVSTDRTKKQREEYNKLRTELKERKKTDPNLTIRNYKIVPFRQAAQETQSWAQIVAGQ